MLSDEQLKVMYEERLRNHPNTRHIHDDCDECERERFGYFKVIEKYRENLRELTDDIVDARRLLYANGLLRDF